MSVGGYLYIILVLSYGSSLFTNLLLSWIFYLSYGPHNKMYPTSQESSPP